jgi:hypothetical protein
MRLNGCNARRDLDLGISGGHAYRTLARLTYITRRRESLSVTRAIQLPIYVAQIAATDVEPTRAGPIFTHIRESIRDSRFEMALNLVDHGTTTKFSTLLTISYLRAQKIDLRFQ